MSDEKHDFFSEDSYKHVSDRCEYNRSKYCLIVDSDMTKINNKYVCKACYNCAKEITHSES